LCLVLMVCWADLKPALAQTRMALVIGNGASQSAA
jgi:hypothetical protein